MPQKREHIPTCSLLERVTGTTNRFSMSFCGNYQCHYKPLWSFARTLNCHRMDIVGNMADVYCQSISSELNNIMNSIEMFLGLES